MVCTACNANVRDGAKVCNKCGEVFDLGIEVDKKFNIEDALKKVSEDIKELPDDTEKIMENKRRHIILDTAVIFMVVGIAIIGFSGFMNGWFTPVKTDYVMDDMYMPLDSLKEFELNGERVVEQSIEAGKVWVFDNPEIAARHAGELETELIKHEVMTYDASKLIKGAAKNGYSVVLGDFSVVSDSLYTIKKFIVSSENGGSALRVFAKSFGMIEGDHSTKMYSTGEGIGKMIGGDVDYFGASSGVGLGAKISGGSADIDFYAKPSLNASGLIGQINSHEGRLMKYAPAADDLIGLFNGAGVKYFVFELMDSVGVDRFDFESSLLTATGISLRDDLLEMMSGEVLASLVSGRDGKGEASLNFLIERTERANEEFNSVLSKLEMYYGEDAKDDFSLIDDGGELKWNAIRYGKDLETEKYKDVLIMKRRIGTFAGQEVGLYIAETEDLFVISSSLAGAKMNLDYVLMKGREVPVGVVNLLGEVSEKEMLKVYLEGVEFAKIFPDSVVPSGFEKFVMQVASVKNGLLGKIDIDGLKGVKAKVEPEVVEVEEEKKVDPAFSAFINDLVNCKVGSKYEGWIRNEMMMMAGAKEILQSYEIVGGEKSACEYVGELKDVNIDKEFVISFALSFGADEAEIREQFAGIDESDMRDELMADASKVKCVGVSHMLVEQLVDQLDGSFKFPDDRSVCEEL